MRTEEEMKMLLLEVAIKEEKIRAVYMNGSRTNPNVKKDIYQDFDIVYVVKDIKHFLNNPNWIDVFGKLLMKQEPDFYEVFKNKTPKKVKSYTYLMLFEDGNRIDLTIQTIDAMYNTYLNDSLTQALLDKDMILPAIQESNDRDYWTIKPNQNEFNACTNEFYWCMQNVAKGLVRDEISYSMMMFHTVVRKQLHIMMDWYIGTTYDFKVSTGKFGKFYKDFLSKEEYNLYLNTYSDANHTRMWKAIENSILLFSELATDVSQYFEYKYNISEEINCGKYINYLQTQLKSRI